MFLNIASCMVKERRTTSNIHHKNKDIMDIYIFLTFDYYVIVIVI